MQQILIRYKNFGRHPSIVKIKLYMGQPEIEFDVFFARLDQKLYALG